MTIFKILKTCSNFSPLLNNTDTNHKDTGIGFQKKSNIHKSYFCLLDRMAGEEYFLFAVDMLEYSSIPNGNKMRKITSPLSPMAIPFLSTHV